jgi:hypothetical protein
MRITLSTGLSRRLIYALLSVLFIVSESQIAMAQEDPPIPIVVTASSQNMSFGAFYHGAVGGAVTITPGGVRSATGDIVLLSLGYPYSAALYNVLATQGTLISLLNGPDATLSGSNSGSLTLHLGATDPPSPFVTSAIPPAINTLYIGGTLTIGNALANPPGIYSGTFDLIFIQE